MPGTTIRYNAAWQVMPGTTIRYNPYQSFSSNYRRPSCIAFGLEENQAQVGRVQCLASIFQPFSEVSCPVGRICVIRLKIAAGQAASIQTLVFERSLTITRSWNDVDVCTSVRLLSHTMVRDEN